MMHVPLSDILGGFFYSQQSSTFTRSMADPKKIATNLFTGGTDTDTADQLLDPTTVRFMLNCRAFALGKKGVVTNQKGNTLIPNTLPNGENTCIGWGKNEEANKFYFFNHNSLGNHGVYCYDDITATIIPVIINLLDTSNVDIFKFSPDYLINHVDIVQDNLIYWVDGLNKARKFNIDKALNNTTTGYGTIIMEDYITAYKMTSVYAPTSQYYTDINRDSNYLYGKQFKFAQAYIYDDGEQSNVSDIGNVPLPPNQNYNGANAISYNNNAIKVQVQAGSKIVTKIQVFVEILSNDTELTFQLCTTLNKAELQIPDNSSYTYTFYNDGPLVQIPQIKILRPYSFLPRVPYAQSFVNKAMTYSNFNEGFPTVMIDASVAVTSQDLYLPNNTVSQLNTPSFIVTETSVTKRSKFLSGSWWETVDHFIIGADVKAGNRFVMTGRNGGSDNYYWSYTATQSDTSLTVASYLKQQLRGTGRGVPDGGNGISNESIDSDGNVSWDYTYLGKYNENKTVFTGSVQPVNYITLLNNGFSVNVIKSGSPRKYAIVYEDDDGRKSLAYTSDALLAKTPFLTQWGVTALQQPIHTISIRNQPPVWAKWWQLVRTQDITSFIQMLIQQVIDVTVVNEGEYLDLVVGSIYTYQLIHPETVIKYEFTRGDRLRLIRDENTTNLYTPYYETEVLSYKEYTEQVIKANISAPGTDHVTPSDGANSDYIGKNISINGIERTILSVSGSDYVLNGIIQPTLNYSTDAQTTSTYPEYKIIDRRGIVRINKPPDTYTLVNKSLVEIYHPQKNTSEKEYQEFYDFSKKFEIANPGTATRAHRGSIQDQDGTNATTLTSTPAVVKITEGDAYIRQRSLPTNFPTDPSNAQVIVDNVEDPNFSDFYSSNLYSLGRKFPQDDGSGEKHFGSRVRYSNNYIQDTKINGLSDFDNTDREDYNDPYGDITLTRFRKNYLFLFKELRTAWTPVGQRIITDNKGTETLATSDKLLNDLQYSEWDGGIGDNGEGWVENGTNMYIPSANSGVFLRIAQNGSFPISSAYLYDSRARELLAFVAKYKLNIYGGFDREHDDALWSIPPFINYLFNNGFLATQWQTQTLLPPNGTTYSIISQPAVGTVTYTSGNFRITGNTTLGNYSFQYQANFPDGSHGQIRNFCFSVIQTPNRPVGWRIRSSTSYCITDGGDNTGDLGWTTLESYYLDTKAVEGRIKPNIPMISAGSIVPTGATITINQDAAVNPPTGGSNNNVWYNVVGQTLYVKKSGTWVLQNTLVINSDYVAPVENNDLCPVGPPDPPTGNNFTVYGGYGLTVESVRDAGPPLGTTGIPASLLAISVPPGSSLSVPYTTVTAGQFLVTVSGAIPPMVNVRINIYVGGVVADFRDIIEDGDYGFEIYSDVNDPTSILISVDTH